MVKGVSKTWFWTVFSTKKRQH